MVKRGALEPPFDQDPQNLKKGQNQSMSLQDSENCLPGVDPALAATFSASSLVSPPKQKVTVLGDSNKRGNSLQTRIRDQAPSSTLKSFEKIASENRQNRSKSGRKAGRRDASVEDKENISSNQVQVKKAVTKKEFEPKR
jgi:hypothetical protein